MTRLMMTLSLGLGLLILAVQTASAQSRNCAPHEAVVANLAERYGESRQSIGLDANNSVVEMRIIRW